MADLERRLQNLTHHLQQRRATIPSFVAQRLEAQGRQAVDAALNNVRVLPESACSHDNVVVSGDHLAEELQRCSAIGESVTQASSIVMQALEQAKESAAQLATIHGSNGSTHETVTDRVIAVDEKENASEAAAAMLRRRHEAKICGTATNKRLC